MNLVPRLSAVLALALLPVLPLHAAPAADSPNGHWITTHISQGGIGSWWDFRPDGTLTLSIGAAVTAKVTHTATHVTAPSGDRAGGTITLEYTITGDTLRMHRPGDRDATFTRLGPAPNAADPLLGRWRPDPPPTYSENPQLATRQRALTHGLYVFTADGNQTVRIPFTLRDGKWDASTHTFRLEGDDHSFHYDRTPQGLKIGLPPDGSRTDTLVPDTAFPE
jgi:hypothetical protein